MRLCFFWNVYVHLGIHSVGQDCVPVLESFSEQVGRC